MNYNKIENYNCYKNKTSNFKAFINEVPVNQDVGYIQLYVFRERGRVPIPDAEVTIYARQTTFVGVPIETFVTTVNPITIELPVAHPTGILITGPEYKFTTYNMTITAAGYSPVSIVNIRIFPGTTENYDINMIEVTPGVFPVPEKIINIPPHPRDLINNQSYYRKFYL
ncbi:hypothetical protein [Sedimentibacter sp. MB31-C6]|uniref:hypothetical protein n=1 Tax=Sedimentibacter sp. MB31-C6 TaxID=3109366 RepID=UPI002DDCC961|nr:hypothetical protein [Sedimentibacter sp. MB36-C1]WSI05037.1 hypothetical protein U8307_04380 [Sedimentibacter sp. MB36-C1]